MTNLAVSMPASGRRAFTVAVTSGKGGVGKSSITANVGAALAETGLRVLLVDADLGLANLDIVMGVTPKLTIADVLEGRARFKDILIKKAPGLELLPAASGMHHLTQLTEGQRATILAGLESLERDFDVVLIDCAAGIAADVLLFAGMSDEVIIVATSDPTSLADAYALIKVLRTERGRRSFRVVPNQVVSDRQARAIFGILSRVTDQYLDVSLDLLGYIPEDDTWRKAVLARRLAFEGARTSKGSTSAMQVARRIAQLEQATGSSQRKGIGAVISGSSMGGTV